MRGQRRLPVSPTGRSIPATSRLGGSSQPSETQPTLASQPLPMPDSSSVVLGPSLATEPLRFLFNTPEEKTISIASPYSHGIAQDIHRGITSIAEMISNDFSKAVNGGTSYPTFLFTIMGFVLESVYNFPFSLVVAPKEVPLGQDEETLMGEIAGEFEYLQPTVIDIYVTVPFYLKHYFLAGFLLKQEENDVMSLKQLKFRYTLLKKFQECVNSEIMSKYGVNLVLDPKLLWPSYKSERVSGLQQQPQ